MEKKCILITGPAHSSTRLLINLLQKHPEVSVPIQILNSVGEYPPLHIFFHNLLLKTPLNKEKYDLDINELKFIIDIYKEKIENSKEFYSIKLPHYPLLYLEEFYSILKPITIIYTKRKTNKIISSYIRRNEHIIYSDNYNYYINQVKKCLLNDRKEILSSKKDIFTVIKKQVLACENKLNEWNTKYPDRKILDVDVEKIAFDKNYLESIFVKIGLKSIYNKDIIKTVLDKNRLLRKKNTFKTKKILKDHTKKIFKKILFQSENS